MFLVFGSVFRVLSEFDPNKNTMPPGSSCLYFGPEMLRFGCFVRNTWHYKLEHQIQNVPTSQIQAVKMLGMNDCLWTTCAVWFCGRTCWAAELLHYWISKSSSARRLLAVISLYCSKLPKQPHSRNELVCQIWLNLCGKRLTTERAMDICLPAQSCSLKKSCG